MIRIYDWSKNHKFSIIRINIFLNALNHKSPKNMNRITVVITASTVALIALIVFQVQWMRNSRDLIEELFDNRVKMALCAAIESVSTDPKGASCALSPKDLENLDTVQFYGEISRALAYFKIPLAYEIQLANDSIIAKNQNQSYCCAMSLDKKETQSVNLIFPDKSWYILEQMGFIAAGPGFGGAAGAFLVPSLSDRFGRKPVIIISLILAAILVYVFDRMKMTAQDVAQDVKELEKDGLKISGY